jgi:hypothetical protein
MSAEAYVGRRSANGPGVIADSGSMARITATTISGNIAEPVRLLTGGILELQAGNAISGVTKYVVVCDDSGGPVRRRLERDHELQEDEIEGQERVPLQCRHAERRRGAARNQAAR